MMMNIMVKTAGKALEKKTDRTPEEEDMLDILYGIVTRSVIGDVEIYFC